MNFHNGGRYLYTTNILGNFTIGPPTIVVDTESVEQMQYQNPSFLWVQGPIYYIYFKDDLRGDNL